MIYLIWAKVAFIRRGSAAATARSVGSKNRPGRKARCPIHF